ncbi:orotidine-5'-phosphate decarboxylase [Candidatus Woesearchaeota archaeon]|nr:orotidine-5'-phosphate decarboxylase [Candidatus Woesearchaeota archaeon]
MEPKDRILIALDVDSKEKALALAEELKDYVGGYKIGKELFTSAGPDLVKSISKHSKVFLDMKYHDIPNTVAGAAKAAAKLGVYMFNIHASGGSEMMKAAADAVKQSAEELGIKKPLIIGVTILTSINQEALNNELNIQGELKDQVIHLAKLAKQAGLDGVVASAKETKLIKEACGQDFLVITPGIRPLWAAKGDQKRVVTPKDALADGSDYLVIGRAITGQPDRIEAAKKILEEIKE